MKKNIRETIEDNARAILNKERRFGAMLFDDDKIRDALIEGIIQYLEKNK